MRSNRLLFESLPPPWNILLPHVANMFAWGVLIGLIYLLRSFFLLLFLTFVFSYIQTSGATRLKPYIKNRIVRVVVVALVFLGILTAAGVFLVPKVKSQTEIFVSQFGTYLSRMDEELYKLQDKYPFLGDVIPELVSSHEKEADAGEIEAKQDELQPDTGSQQGGKQPRRGGVRYSPSAALLQQFMGLGESSSGVQNINQFIDTLGNIGGKIVAFTTTFLLSLLFSFLIVLDLPALGRQVRNLSKTKLRLIYVAVADNIRDFSQVLGKALEAQLIIAIINSGLTAIGISLLGLGESVAFLSVIVFFFSFFPVIGVFLSSIPICLVALQDQGVNAMLLAILLITIIHLIEGYILNPRIYGSYMRINAVIILIILTIAGKLFGFWGLILGVPVCTYIFGYAIRFRPTPPGGQLSAGEGGGESKEASTHTPDNTALTLVSAEGQEDTKS